APKPTRLATLRAGSTEALAPASMLARNAGRYLRLRMTSVADAASNAVTTAQTPPTADSEVAPHRSSARNETSRRGRITSDISRLTTTTTTSGEAARTADGNVALAAPCRISAGSNSRAVVARSRTVRSSAAVAAPAGASAPKPSPARRAEA